MSLKSQTLDPRLNPLPDDLCSGFLHPEKIHRPQSGSNTRTLYLETSASPRDHQNLKLIVDHEEARRKHLEGNILDTFF